MLASTFGTAKTAKQLLPVQKLVSEELQVLHITPDLKDHCVKFGLIYNFYIIKSFIYYP